MSVLDTLSPPPRCSADDCPHVPLPGQSVCTWHTKTNHERFAELTREAIEAVATSLRTALLEQDYRASANIAQKVLDRTGFGPSATLDVQVTSNAPWAQYLTDAQLEQIAGWIADAKARMNAGDAIEAEVRVVRSIAAEPEPEPEPEPDAREMDHSPICEPDPEVADLSSKPPLEQCPFCHKPLADCDAMRAARPDVFEALHYNSPEMIEKRRQYDTAVMMRQIGKPLPDFWYR